MKKKSDSVLNFLSESAAEMFIKKSQIFYVLGCFGYHHTMVVTYDIWQNSQLCPWLIHFLGLEGANGYWDADTVGGVWS